MSVALPSGVSPASIPGSIAARRLAKARPLDAVGGMAYHGGPVVHGLTTYALFWDPAGEIPPRTRSVIDGYFADVARDSGTNGNDYSVLQQYTDSSGADIAYDQAFGGELVDANPYPANPPGCTHDGSDLDGYPSETSHCLLDSQLVDELEGYVASHGLPTGLRAQYFVFTPPSVIACLDAPTNGICSDNIDCAYHGFARSGATTLLYAVDPMTFEYDPAGHPRVMKRCQADRYPALQEPNGDAADVVLKAVGHEARETLSDPLLNAWFDSSGNELDDRCNAQGTSLGRDPNAFLPTLGGSPADGTLFTQLYGGHPYYMQSEWSNGQGACVMQPGAGTVAPAFTPPPPQAVGSSWTFTSAATSSSPVASTSWDFGDGVTAAGPTQTHTYAVPGTHQVTLRVTDSLGNAATVSHSIVAFANSFSFGSVTLDRRSGTAMVPVEVPGAGLLRLSGRGLVSIPGREASSREVQAGTTNVPVRAAGSAARALRRRGSETVTARVTYRPTGADAVSKTKRIKLVRSR